MKADNFEIQSLLNSQIKELINPICIYSGQYEQYFNITNKIVSDEIDFDQDVQNSEMFGNIVSEKKKVDFKEKLKTKELELIQKAQDFLKLGTKNLIPPRSNILKEKLRTIISGILKQNEKIALFDQMEEYYHECYENRNTQFEELCLPPYIGIYNLSQLKEKNTNSSDIDIKVFNLLFEKYENHLLENGNIIKELRSEYNIEKLSTKKQLLLLFFLSELEVLQLKKIGNKQDIKHVVSVYANLLNRDCSNIHKSYSKIIQEKQLFLKGNKCEIFTKENLTDVFKIFEEHFDESNLERIKKYREKLGDL